MAQIVASSHQINEASKMVSIADMFVCGFCKYIVQPFPLECPSCNALYCSKCVQSQMRWRCQVMACGSMTSPVEMHRSVKEILEMLMINCPGCDKKLRYESAFAHIANCDKVTAAMKKSRADLISSAAQQNDAGMAAQTASLADDIYIIEKDTKSCAVYNRRNNTLFKGVLNLLNERNQLENNLPHNFQLVQVGSKPLVYLVGGGDFAPEPIPQTMYMMRLLQYNAGNKTFNLQFKAKMTYPRHGHSATAFADRYVVVTGSRKDTQQASEKVEIYDTTKNTWTQLGDLRHGRHYHSSCEFNSEFAFVFCGIRNQNKKYFNIIERLNVKASLNNFNVQWEVINITDPSKSKPVQIPVRQGNGAVQYDKDTIMILGGFGGKFYSDCWDFNPNQNTAKLSHKQLGREVFPFAVPTVSDINAATVITVDWRQMQILQFSGRNQSWNLVKKIKE